MPAPGGRTAYLTYRGGAGLARVVPGAVGRPTARMLAQAASLTMMRGRAQQVERNLRRIHGPDVDPTTVRRGVAATFDSYGRYFYELFRLPGASRAWIDAHFSATGMEHVRAAIDAGRGAVVALPHLGNWDFAGAWLAGQGYQLTVVAEPVQPPELFEWFVEARRRLGITVVPLARDATPRLLGALRDNHVVCLLADRDLTGDGVRVQLFGETTTMPGGPALLALRSGAPLIPAGCYFRQHGRHVARVLPPIETVRTAGLRDDVTRITQLLAARFEDLIRAAPAHWHLMQPNWPSDHTSAVTS